MFSDIFGIKTLVPPTDSSILLNLQSAPVRRSLPTWGRVREGLLSPFVWICNPDAFAIRICNPIKQKKRIKRIVNPDILFTVGLQIRQNGEFWEPWESLTIFINCQLSIIN